MQEGNLIAALQDLRKREIQFVLVGGLAAALHGAPVQTYDVDLVYSREAENVGRLPASRARCTALKRPLPGRPPCVPAAWRFQRPVSAVRPVLADCCRWSPCQPLSTLSPERYRSPTFSRNL